MATSDSALKVFTREEFYELVWSAPGTRLAIELGCSDVMIGKICKAYDIPKPYLGYWAKLANGQTPRRRRLPANDDPNLQTLTFRLEQSGTLRVEEPLRELSYDSDIQEVLTKARNLGPVEVFDKLGNLHSLVKSTKERLRQLKAWEKIPWSERQYTDLDKLPAGLAIEVSDGLLDRTLRMMDAR